MNAMALPRPPESLRPDRWETMNEPGKNPPVALAPGVSLDCLVGAHNGARNLTTGLTTLEPEAKLPYHCQPVSEAITVLSGDVVVAVEVLALPLIFGAWATAFVFTALNAAFLYVRISEENRALRELAG